MINVNDLNELLLIKISELTSEFTDADLFNDALLISQVNDDTGKLPLGEFRNWLLDSPTLTGVPLVPTALPGTSTDQIASTAFVQGELAELGLNPASIAAFGTVKTDQNDPNPTVYLKSTVDSLLGTKANSSALAGYLPLSGGTLTGNLALGNNNLTGFSATLNGAINAVNANIGSITLSGSNGAINASNLTLTGTINALSLTTTGNINANRVDTVGNMVAGNSVTATNLVSAPNGSFPTSLGTGSIIATASIRTSTQFISDSNTVGFEQRYSGSANNGYSLSCTADNKLEVKSKTSGTDTLVARLGLTNQFYTASIFAGVDANTLNTNGNIAIGAYLPADKNTSLRFHSKSDGSFDASITKNSGTGDFYIANNSGNTFYTNTGILVETGSQIQLRASTASGVQIFNNATGANTINYQGFYRNDGFKFGHELNVGYHIGLSDPTAPSNASAGLLQITTPSDQRVKKNINPINRQQVITAIRALNPVSFRYKEDELSQSFSPYKGVHVGLIAQDVDNELPILSIETKQYIDENSVSDWEALGFTIDTEIIDNEDGSQTTQKSTKIKGIKYDFLPIINTAAVKELIEEIIILRQRVTALENQLNP